MQQGGAASQLARERRKALREVLKVVADSSVPLEERMRLLQGRFAGVLQEQLRQDKQVVELQAQLDASRREAEAGVAELGHSQQKADSLQKLARGLTQENQTLQEEVNRLRQHTHKAQDIMQSIEGRIAEQQHETQLVLEQNKVLLQEKALLEAQLEATKNVVEDLRTTQQDRLAALAEQLQQQSAAMTKAAAVHEAMEAMLKENQTLTLRAALADNYKERNELLEKALGEAQVQSAGYRSQLTEMQKSLAAATKVMQGLDKIKQTMADQKVVTTQLLTGRQLLQEQMQLLQQQNRDQADKLRRLSLQKQRLEGLCRSLQARSGDAAATTTVPDSACSGGAGAAACTDNTEAAEQADATGVLAPSSGEQQQEQEQEQQQEQELLPSSDSCTSAPAAHESCAPAASKSHDSSNTCTEALTAAPGAATATCVDDATAAACHSVMQEVLSQLQVEQAP